MSYANKAIESIEIIERYICDKNYEEFLQNEELIDAIMFRLIQMIENVKNISADFKKNNSQIPWGDIIGFRNGIVHDYGKTDYLTVYETITKDILTEEMPIDLTFDKIMNEVAKTFGVSTADIKSQRRSAQVSSARQAGIYIAHTVMDLPMVTIGEYFGGRDHSTVIYALNKITKRMNTDYKFKETIEDIIKNIKR